MPSVGDFVLPEYPELKLNFPPILDVMDFIEREGFTRIHISTPGTVGLLGLLIARMMNIPVAGTYHTDIPQYVRSLTNDEFLEQAAWSYMIWFYSQMEEVMVPSAGTREQLHSRGLPPERMKPLPRWVDTDSLLAGDAQPELLEESRRRFRQDGAALCGARLPRKGAGNAGRAPSGNWLRRARRLRSPSSATVRTGMKWKHRLQGIRRCLPATWHGEQLQRGYASADLFVFPSATDTFGNVVLEAQASGLPVIVSDEGGPRELMIDGETGVVFRPAIPAVWPPPSER